MKLFRLTRNDTLYFSEGYVGFVIAAHDEAEARSYASVDSLLWQDAAHTTCVEIDPDLTDTPRLILASFYQTGHYTTARRPMKLFLLKAFKDPGWDFCAGFVIYAHDEVEARLIAQANGGDETYAKQFWTDPTKAECTEILANVPTDAQVVLSSYNAG